MKSCSDKQQKLSSFPMEIKSVYVPDGGSLTFEYEESLMAKAYTLSFPCFEQSIFLGYKDPKLEMTFKDGTKIEDWF